MIRNIRIPPWLTSALKGFVFLAVVTIIVLELRSIGFGNILHALPRTPYFYLLGGILYLVLPLSDMQIYARLWPLPRASLLIATLRKRVLNEGILGYSGEAHLCLWAAKQLQRPFGSILGNVRDVNLLSALVSTVAAAILVVFLAGATDSPGIKALLTYPVFMVGVPVTLIASLIAIGLNVRFRFGMLSPSMAATVFAFHGLRLLIVNCILIAQWSVAQPAIPLSAWLSVLAAQMIATRIPMLPNQELVLLGVGIGMAGTLGIPDGDIAALFLASGAMMMTLHLVTLVLTALLGTRILNRAVLHR